MALWTIIRKHSSIIKTKNQFEYKYITPQDEEEALNLLSHSFAKHEGLTSYLGIPEHIFKEFGKNALDNYKGRELSIVCVHKPTSEVCGVILNNGISQHHPEKYSKIVEEYLANVFILINELESKFNKVVREDLDKVCHFFTCAVKK